MSDLKAHWLEEGMILYEGEARVDSAPGAGGKDRGHSAPNGTAKSSTITTRKFINHAI